eukprot:m.153362 g.153362  ORF g.153362 m.153362 type:complete len:90 (+) comp23444_c0_seq1:411-680(+)
MPTHNAWNNAWEEGRCSQLQPLLRIPVPTVSQLTPHRPRENRPPQLQLSLLSAPTVPTVSQLTPHRPSMALEPPTLPDHTNGSEVSHRK